MQFVVKSRIVSVTDHLGLALLVRTSSKAISKLHSGDILPVRCSDGWISERYSYCRRSYSRITRSLLRGDGEGAGGEQVQAVPAEINDVKSEREIGQAKVNKVEIE